MHTLSKRERLKSTALMDLAFAKGVNIKAFPILARAVQAQLPQEVPFQAAFSVGKKRFRRAVDRNRIKRLMREAWRVEKTVLAKNWEPGAPPMGRGVHLCRERDSDVFRLPTLGPACSRQIGSGHGPRRLRGPH